MLILIYMYRNCKRSFLGYGALALDVHVTFLLFYHDLELRHWI